MGGPYIEEVPHGAQAHAIPSPCRVSAPLADSDASGGRGGTTADGCAQSVVAGSAPAGTARPAAAATAYPHAPATPDAARHRGHHGELGVAAGPIDRCGAEGLGPRRLVGDSTAAGQSPGHYQTACRVAGSGDGPALGGSLCAAAGAGAAHRAPPALGTGASALLVDCPGRWFDPRSAAQKDAGL